MTDDLKYLVNCYFHEDWDLDTPTWEGVANMFVHRNAGSSRPIGVLGELTVVLESPLVEGERFYLEWDMAFWPLESTPMEDWLRALRDRIAEEVVANGHFSEELVADAVSRFEPIEPEGVAAVADAVERASTFGAVAPIDEVFGFLSAMTLALATPKLAANERGRLQEVRTAIARAAVQRWDRTARHL